MIFLPSFIDIALVIQERRGLNKLPHPPSPIVTEPPKRRVLLGLRSGGSEPKDGLSETEKVLTIVV